MRTHADLEQMDANRCSDRRMRTCGAVHPHLRTLVYPSAIADMRTHMYEPNECVCVLLIAVDVGTAVQNDHQAPDRSDDDQVQDRRWGLSFEGALPCRRVAHGACM